MRIRILILSVLIVQGLTSCNRTDSEFSSCADYPLKSYTHELAAISMALPAEWDTQVKKVQGDSVWVIATDMNTLEKDDHLRTLGFIQFSSISGYRKNASAILRSLNKKSATLIAARGLLRINGTAMDYVIGNDELVTTLLIPYEHENRMLLIIARVDRKNDPTLKDFCFVGPVLEHFVRNHSNLQS